MSFSGPLLCPTCYALRHAGLIAQYEEMWTGLWEECVQRGCDHPETFLTLCRERLLLEFAREEEDLNRFQGGSEMVWGRLTRGLGTETPWIQSS